MIQFKDLRNKLDDVIKQLNDIKIRMQQYSKLDVDYRAPALIEEIDKRIAQINGAYINVYSAKEFENMYGAKSTHDYSEYLKFLNDQVMEYEKIYQKIVKFESVFGYYN